MSANRLQLNADKTEGGRGRFAEIRFADKIDVPPTRVGRFADKFWTFRQRQLR